MVRVKVKEINSKKVQKQFPELFEVVKLFKVHGRLKELVDKKCPDHQTEPTYIQEKNYFFRMGKYQQRLLDHIQSRPDFIRPEHYRAEVLAFLREPLEDLCISRPKSRRSEGRNSKSV